MASDPGFVIDGVEYPVPQAFRLGDPVLVREITGLEWMEFAELLDAGSTDPAAMLGLVAVAVWQANPDWKRDKVRRFVEGLAFDRLEFQAPDENPTVAAIPDAATTGSSPAASAPGPESVLGSTLATTGTPA